MFSLHYGGGPSQGGARCCRGGVAAPGPHCHARQPEGQGQTPSIRGQLFSYHMFANHQVPPEALPDVEELDWRPLHPRFVRRLQVGTAIRTSAFAGIGAGAHYAAATGGLAALLRAAPWLPAIVWSALAALSLWALAWPMIAVPRHDYAVRDRDILYRSGVLWRSVRAIPFNRVQHTKTDSAPLDRRFGLANLSVFPAGGGGHKIRGLGRETAERLRAFVSARIEAETGDEALESDVGDAV